MGQLASAAAVAGSSGIGGSNVSLAAAAAAGDYSSSGVDVAPSSAVRVLGASPLPAVDDVVDAFDELDVGGSGSGGDNASNCTNQYCVSDEAYIDMIRDYVRPNTFEWCVIALYFVVFVVGVVGNGLVVYVVLFDRRMRTVTNLFIVNLSVADFLVVVVCLPPTVLGDVTETWFMGSVMCKIVLYLQVGRHFTLRL